MVRRRRPSSRFRTDALAAGGDGSAHCVNVVQAQWAAKCYVDNSNSTIAATDSARCRGPPIGHVVSTAYRSPGLIGTDMPARTDAVRYRWVNHRVIQYHSRLSHRVLPPTSQYARSVQHRSEGSRGVHAQSRDQRRVAGSKMQRQIRQMACRMEHRQPPPARLWPSPKPQSPWSSGRLATLSQPGIGQINSSANSARQLPRANRVASCCATRSCR